MSRISVLILSRSMAGAEILDVVRKRHETLGIDCHTLTFNPDASDNIIFPHVAGRIKNIDKGDGVLVLIDSDATHRGLFERLSQELNVKCIVGYNDAMIHAIKECQHKSLEAAAKHLLQAAIDGIHLV